MNTKSQNVASEITFLLRARNPLLWIVTKEESRVERYLIEAAAAASYVPRCWDVAQGVTGINGKAERIGATDPGEMLAFIRERAEVDGASAERGAWIMRDLPAWLEGAMGITTLRGLGNVADLCGSFTGSEIAALVPDALFAAFADGAREIDCNDLVKAAASVTPLAKTAREKITKLRSWAAGRARPASIAAPEERAARDRSRLVDVS